MTEGNPELDRALETIARLGNHSPARDPAAEIERLRAALSECERQFQEQVAEVGRLTDAILYARREGFEWPTDPFDNGQHGGTHD